jgi:Transglycosylase SLT domain/Domain of unknown function (DUF4124)
MPWRLAIIAALLAWLVLPGSAGAAIQHHTDAQGVIHISNCPPARPRNRLSQAVAPGATASRPEPGGSPSDAPLKLPSASASLAHQLSEIVPQAAGPRLARRPDSTLVEKYRQDSSMPVASGASPAPLPLRQISYEPAKANSAPARARQSFISKPENMLAAGGIRRYQDRQGVWHITNVAPAADGGGPLMLEAEAHEDQKGAFSPAAALEPKQPLQRVAWNPDNVRPATLSRLCVPTGTLGPANGIRRFRDSMGVIHIENVEPAPPAPPPRQLQAGTRPPLRLPHLAAYAREKPWVVRPAAWSGEASLSKALSLNAPARPKTEMASEGGIRRWRDKQGVWHIKTVEYPRPGAIPLPSVRDRSDLEALLAQAPLAPAPPPALRGPPVAASKPPLMAERTPGTTSITAYRDRQGRLHITSEAPLVALGQAPPQKGAVAPAALAPLITEAADAYRLPPTLVRAVIKVESDFCPWAVSPKGAMGLMQLMPGTAAFLGVQEPFNPRENVLGGCRYLRLLLDSFGGNLPLALAGYNAGFQRVVACGYRVPPIKETQQYVTQVMGRYITEEKKLGLPWT